MEEELLKTGGIEDITSASATGFSTVIATLEDGDSETTKAQIRQKVEEVSRSFPEEVKSPEINTDMKSPAVWDNHLYMTSIAWIPKVKANSEITRKWTKISRGLYEAAVFFNHGRVYLFRD